ncbi:MAG: HD domain-containing protein [Chloroflexota bacterium]|nr:HD domain-containing protein [Chloroflexota bacterium]
MDRAPRPDRGSTAAPAIPPPVEELLQTLWSAGHAAYVVGGSLRDALLARTAADWDLATDARPERLLEIFPGAVYENRFGTVSVRHGDRQYEITTFRVDHDYADFRRPARVEFGDRIEADLARRDFTVNAMAWGAPAPAASGGSAATSAGSAATSAGSAAPVPALVDPFGGRADVERRLLRAVGEPGARFEEDALRMVRAVRLAATLEFAVEPATLAAIETRADLVRHLSGQRLGAELDKLLAAGRPSVGLRLLADTGLLERVSPVLAAQRGIAQNKVEGEDLWDHTLRTVDAAPANRPIVRLAALVHDMGKPETAADGHFYGHDKVGAERAQALLEQLHYPRAVADRVVALVRLHMLSYQPTWSDTAVRRFIAKVGKDALDDLFELGAADNVGSGRDRDGGGLGELRRRVGEQLAADVALDRADLAVDGDDLIAELGLAPGPEIGRVLDALLERVMNDPALNDRPTLLMVARTLVGEKP